MFRLRSAIRSRRLRRSLRLIAMQSRLRRRVQCGLASSEIHDVSIRLRTTDRALIPLAYRQVIRLSTGAITAISIVPDFPWLLVLSSGILLAFSLIDMLPTSEPSTWVLTGRSQAEELSRPECPVSLLKIGATKGRLLGTFFCWTRTDAQLYTPSICATPTTQCCIASSL